MSMPIKLERINGEIYFVSEWNEYHCPNRHILKWKAEGPGFRVPDEQLGQWFHTRGCGGIDLVSVPCGPFGSIDLYISKTAYAEISERVPIPPPKVRKGIEVRYHNSRWEKCTKREGWIPA